MLRTLPSAFTLIDGLMVTFTDTPEVSPANDTETRENSMIAQTVMTMHMAVNFLNADLLVLISLLTSTPINGKTCSAEHGQNR